MVSDNCAGALLLGEGWYSCCFLAFGTVKPEKGGGAFLEADCLCTFARDGGKKKCLGSERLKRLLWLGGSSRDHRGIHRVDLNHSESPPSFRIPTPNATSLEPSDPTAILIEPRVQGNPS